MTDQRPASIQSSSSYSPVLINPLDEPGPSNHANPITTPPTRRLSDRTPSPLQLRKQPHLILRIRYPYPLPIAAILDLAYNVRHYIKASISPPTYLFVLVCARVLVLGVVVGCSRRWRNRGGWIAGTSGTSFGAAVWTFCQDLLVRGQVGSGGWERLESVHATFLLFTALISGFEFILFVLLLRLSPPNHRSHPFALRLPNSAIQSFTAFAFQADPENPESEDVMTPGSTRRKAAPGARRYSRRSRSASNSHLQGFDRSESRQSNRPGDVQDDHIPQSSDSSYHQHSDFDFDPNEEDLEYQDQRHDHSEDDSSSTSSISDSSIIDLPPPLLPARIIPPTSLSISRGLDMVPSGIDLDQSPVLGSLVRRSRSARFLGRSWGSGRSSNGLGGGEEAAGNTETSGGDSERRTEGYGTFGRR